MKNREIGKGMKCKERKWLKQYTELNTEIRLKTPINFRNLIVQV